MYKSEFKNGKYEEPEELDVLNANIYECSGAEIAEDESYIIFSSIRDDGFGKRDLYVSFNNGMGEWTEPVNMGDQINTGAEDLSATISADGKFLFYNRGFSPYWIKLDEIEVMKNN